MVNPHDLFELRLAAGRLEDGLNNFIICAEVFCAHFTDR